jgi:hypothetical protein
MYSLSVGASDRLQTLQWISRWVCLCLDAHNFVAGPASRADEISGMMPAVISDPRPATAQPTCLEAKFNT